MRNAPTFFALAIALSLSASAFAQTASYFVVTNDGSRYEGQLVENVVGNHVTIKLASGELRTFQAADVREQGTETESQTFVSSLAQLQVGLPGGPPVRYTGPDAVQVHITKSNNGQGTLFVESASGWQRVCETPCSTTVDPKIDYKLRNSDPFRFPAGPPLDLVENSGGRRTYSAIGWTLISVSLIAWIPGLLFQVGAFDGGDSSARTPAEQASQHGSNNVVAGVIYGVSGAMLVAGIVLASIHPSSSLTTVDGLRRIAKRGGIPITDGLTLTPTGLAF